jgi:hypothetical protein
MSPAGTQNTSPPVLCAVTVLLPSSAPLSSLPPPCCPCSDYSGREDRCDCDALRSVLDALPGAQRMVVSDAGCCCCCDVILQTHPVLHTVQYSAAAGCGCHALAKGIMNLCVCLPPLVSPCLFLCLLFSPCVSLSPLVSHLHLPLPPSTCPLPYPLNPLDILDCSSGCTPSPMPHPHAAAAAVGGPHHPGPGHQWRMRR